MINTSANVVISKANEVFLRVKADPHIEYELRDYFTFQVDCTIEKCGKSASFYAAGITP